MRKAPGFWIVTQLYRQGLHGRRFAARAWRLAPLLWLAAACMVQPVFAQSTYYNEPSGGRMAIRWSMPERSQSPDIASGDEQEILRLVNRERQSRGLAPLVSDERLQQAARRHSERMAAANEISHQFAGEPELELRLRAVRFDVSGENVAVAANAERAHNALMHSPHHRANILDRDYNSIGIGVVRTGSGVFVTQDFAHRLSEASVEQVEEQVARYLDRRHNGLRRVPAPELRRRACEMAASDRVDPEAGMLPHVSNAVAFTALDLAELPESLRGLPSRASAFSVGACYRASASYQNPVFWVIVATYP